MSLQLMASITCGHRGSRVMSLVVEAYSGVTVHVMVHTMEGRHVKDLTNKIKLAMIFIVLVK